MTLYLFDEAIVIHHSLAREGTQERAWWGIHYLHYVILALAFKRQRALHKTRKAINSLFTLHSI